MTLLLEERVTDLEHLLAEFLRAQTRTQRQLDQLSREMSDFKREMSDYKEENRREWRAFRQSLAEDTVAPSIPRILHEIVNCPEPPSMEGVRIRKRLRDGRSKEYDVVATCGNYLLGDSEEISMPASPSQPPPSTGEESLFPPPTGGEG